MFTEAWRDKNRPQWQPWEQGCVSDLQREWPHDGYGRNVRHVSQVPSLGDREDAQAETEHGKGVSCVRGSGTVGLWRCLVLDPWAFCCEASKCKSY